ncbi:MAG: HPr family phosphocarrier protein [Oscillospiraceae bacterium]|jgi:phosphotransferase system HPr (HPr) family protein|nr:HPr family phosphocarrier protein [Oscillospiraceae bacterium]
MRNKMFVVNCKEGFHLRPAQILVERMMPFQSQIEIQKAGEEKADAKSILGLMSLGVQTGEKVNVLVDGPDEDQAMNAVEQLFAANFEEA